MDGWLRRNFTNFVLFLFYSVVVVVVGGSQVSQVSPKFIIAKNDPELLTFRLPLSHLGLPVFATTFSLCSVGDQTQDLGLI